MSGAEAVEQLTDIIARQARIIRELYNVVGQLGATTSLSGEVEEIQREAHEAISGTPER